MFSVMHYENDYFDILVLGGDWMGTYKPQCLFACSVFTMIFVCLFNPILLGIKIQLCVATKTNVLFY